MAKKKKRSKGWLKLFIFMLVYAILFLGFTAWGLDKFWDYIEAYELSRPQIAMDAYMEQLDPETIVDRALDWTGEIDGNLQDEQVRRQYLSDKFDRNITCAKKLSECSDTKTVYVLLSGDQPIGKVTLTPMSADEYGFTPWQVAEETFDLAYLVQETGSMTITVPYDYTVFVGGVALDSGYIVQDNIRYDVLEPYYGSYELPWMVTYQAGPVLGEAVVTVADASGNEVPVDNDTDPNTFLDNCTQTEKDALSALAEAFVKRYVDFTSCAGNDSERNYNRLAQHMVPDGDLAQRMYNALGGLEWSTDRNSEVTAITLNHLVSIGGGRYLCDVTYDTTSSDYSGQIQTTSSLKLIVLETESGLKVETMTGY